MDLKTMPTTAKGVPGAFRTALKEALIILFSAFFLGSVYSSVMHKGLFGRPHLPKPASLSKPAGSPEAITVGEAEKYHSSGKALFIDTRSESIYRAGHIEGAMNIQLNQIEGEIEFLKEISSEKILIVYCDGSACHSSIEFSSRLLSCGVTNIRVFFGGWEEWSAARLPTVRDRP